MTNEEWKEIIEAKRLLGLPDQATLAQIKQAYRSLCKKHHPDLADNSDPDAEDESVEMHRLTAAYQTLINYCTKYLFPLVPGEDQPLEGEDWWMDRFGDDPLWGPGRPKD